MNPPKEHRPEIDGGWTSAQWKAEAETCRREVILFGKLGMYDAAKHRAEDAGLSEREYERTRLLESGLRLSPT